MDRAGPPGGREIRFLGYSGADPDGSPQRARDRRRSYSTGRYSGTATMQGNTCNLVAQASRRVWSDCPKKREIHRQSPSRRRLGRRYTAVPFTGVPRFVRRASGDVCLLVLEAGRGPAQVGRWAVLSPGGQPLTNSGALVPGGRGSRCLVVRRFRGWSGSNTARGIDSLIPRRGTPAVPANDAPSVPRKPRICCPSSVQGPASRAPRLALIGHTRSSTDQPTAHPSERERGCVVTAIRVIVPAKVPPS